MVYENEKVPEGTSQICEKSCIRIPISHPTLLRNFQRQQDGAPVEVQTGLAD